MRTLVLGCDASGKSSMMEGISGMYGDVAIEATSTPKSRQFKVDNLSTLVDEGFIAARESLYLELGQAVMNEFKDSSQDVLTTSATLVTRVSHDVMRRCVSLPGVSDKEIITTWLNDEARADATMPDIIVHTHAPFEVIHGRISDRQQQGKKEEKFWGFNSPFFLDAYQQRWHKVVAHLSAAGMRCLSIDTSKRSIDESLSMYADLRDIESAA